jgi:hypothetical protein
LRRLRGDRQDANRADRDVVFDLVHPDALRQQVDVFGRTRLRQHDAVRPQRDHGREIRAGLLVVQGVDAHPQLLPTAGRSRGQEFLHPRPGRGLVLGRHGVFQVADQCVRRDAFGPGQFPLAVAGYEQQGTQQAHLSHLIMNVSLT